MTTAHAPEFITSQTDKTVRSILYVCWIATFNTAEHHLGLELARSQVRCMLFACHDGRNAGRRSQIDEDVYSIVEWIHLWRDKPAIARPQAVKEAKSLSALRGMAVTT